MHIEIAKRLIEEEQLRGRRQGARQRYALLLAPGQLVWIALCQVLQPHQPQHLDQACAAPGIRLFESGYEAQQSRLTTAAWAEQADHSARFHLQGDITQYRHLRLEAFTD